MFFRNPSSTEPPILTDTSNGAPFLSLTEFDVIAAVTVDTIETVGPTGSGADHIWSALDLLPAGVHWVLASAIGRSRHTTTNSGYTMMVRANGSSVPMSIGSDLTTVFRFQSQPDATYGLLIGGFFVIPLSAAGVFDIRFLRVVPVQSDEVLRIALRGYGNNGVIT